MASTFFWSVTCFLTWKYRVLEDKIGLVTKLRLDSGKLLIKI